MGRSVLPDDGINGEPFHEPAELLRRELSGFRRIAWPGEMPVFHALCEEKKSIPLPEEPFDLAGTPAAEKEQGVRNKERQMVPLLDNGSKGIHAIAHICVAADHIDSGEGGGICIPKHGAGP